MTTKQAIKEHGPEVSEERIGTEDRLVGYADGTFGWQARGSAEVFFPTQQGKEYACYSPRDRAIADYNAT